MVHALHEEMECNVTPWLFCDPTLPKHPGGTVYFLDSDDATIYDSVIQTALRNRGNLTVRIVLIMPRGALYRHEKGIFRKPIRYAPLTLTTLAALVPEEIDAEIEIIDEGVQTLPDSLDADLVGITAITGTSMRAYTIADRLKARGIPVVLGGVHPTLMPEEASQHADAVVTGFAEESWPQLLRDFVSLGRTKPFYRQSLNLTISGFPIARRDLVKRSGYVTVHTMQATRGCINQCDFCVVPVAWGQRMYLRPVEEVIQELEQIGSRDVLFVDVSPIEDKKYARELYRAMIPLGKRWMSPSTMKIADDDELLELAARSGCRGLLIGFESVSQQTLKGMGKAFNYVDKYKNQVEKLHSFGIAIQACFVFGFDTDDKNVFEKTVEFVDKLRLDLPRYTVYTPFPGTPVFGRLDGENRIIERDWSFYDAQHVVFQPKLMSPDELRQGLYWAWENSYTIGSMFRRLSGAHCVLQYSIPANIAYRFYGHNLRKYSREMMSDNSSISGLGEN